MGLVVPTILPVSHISRKDSGTVEVKFFNERKNENVIFTLTFEQFGNLLQLSDATKPSDIIGKKFCTISSVTTSQSKGFKTLAGVDIEYTKKEVKKLS